LFLFLQALTLSRARITKKAAETQQRSCVTELEEANRQLLVELAAANAKVAEVERRERALISKYSILSSDFSDLETAHATLGMEKEKVECEKSQQFRNLLHKILVGLCHDMEKSVVMLYRQCFEFPATNATVGDMLDWFWTEVQALPTTFAESNQNNTCYAVAGILRMLAEVECGHQPELQKLVISCDASLQHDIPEHLGKIARKLVQNCWTNHGLSYCMQWVEELNRVSFILILFIA
jgi:hypothetical protein